MLIGERLRTLREERKLSQGDIEKRTGLLRCYISRVENGHTVPAVETIEKLARAMEIPMYRVFYEGDKPKAPVLPESKDGRELEWGSRGRDAKLLRKFRRLLAQTSDGDKRLLLHMAQKMRSTFPAHRIIGTR